MINFLNKITNTPLINDKNGLFCKNIYYSKTYTLETGFGSYLTAPLRLYEQYFLSNETTKAHQVIPSEANLLTDCLEFLVELAHVILDVSLRILLLIPASIGIGLHSLQYHTDSEAKTTIDTAIILENHKTQTTTALDLFTTESALWTLSYEFLHVSYSSQGVVGSENEGLGGLISFEDWRRAKEANPCSIRSDRSIDYSFSFDSPNVKEEIAQEVNTVTTSLKNHFENNPKESLKGIECFVDNKNKRAVIKAYIE